MRCREVQAAVIRASCTGVVRRGWRALFGRARCSRGRPLAQLPFAHKQDTLRPQEFCTWKDGPHAWPGACTSQALLNEPSKTGAPRNTTWFYGDGFSSVSSTNKGNHNHPTRRDGQNGSKELGNGSAQLDSRGSTAPTSTAHIHHPQVPRHRRPQRHQAKQQAARPSPKQLPHA